MLYGIGAQQDKQPELLFRLHEVDQAELIAKAGTGLPLAKTARSKVLSSDDLSGIFGLDMAPEAAAQKSKTAKKKAARRRVILKSRLP